jgi:hypothetical protein
MERHGCRSLPASTALVLGIASYFLNRRVAPRLLVLARLDLHRRLHTVPDAGMIAMQAAHRGIQTVIVAKPLVSRQGPERNRLNVRVVRTVHELLREAFGITQPPDPYLPGYL